MRLLLTKCFGTIINTLSSDFTCLVSVITLLDYFAKNNIWCFLDIFGIKTAKKSFALSNRDHHTQQFIQDENKILLNCLQGNYRLSLGEFSNTSDGVFGLRGLNGHSILAQHTYFLLSSAATSSFL